MLAVAGPGTAFAAASSRTGAMVCFCRTAGLGHVRRIRRLSCAVTLTPAEELQCMRLLQARRMSTGAEMSNVKRRASAHQRRHESGATETLRQFGDNLYGLVGSWSCYNELL